MSNNSVVISTLITKRELLLDEKAKAVARFDGEISEIETALEQLSGKRVWEIAPALIYDDERHDYIQQSQEEM